MVVDIEAIEDILKFEKSASFKLLRLRYFFSLV